MVGCGQRGEGDSVAGGKDFAGGVYVFFGGFGMNGVEVQSCGEFWRVKVGRGIVMLEFCCGVQVYWGWVK